MPPSRTDVAVIGAGAIGLAAALELARLGREVVVVDRHETAASASTRNAGQIRPAACTPLAAPGAVREAIRAATMVRGRPIRFGARAPRNWRWLTAFAGWARGARLEDRVRALAELGKLSEEAFTALEERTGEPLLTRRGALDIYETAEAWAAASEAVRQVAARGFAAEIVSRDRVEEAVPGFAGGFAGAVHFPGAAHCDPATLLERLRRLAREAGVGFLSQRDVLGVSEGNRVELVETSRWSLAADLVVVAAGHRTPRLFTKASARTIPIVAGRGYGVDVESDAEVRLPLILAERHIAITPMTGRVTRLTSGMELGVSRPDVSWGRRRALLGQAVDVAPALERHGRTRAWSAPRPMTPDGVPIVGFVPGRPRILLASGHGMLGLTHGPGTGRLVARLVTGDPPPWAARLDPARFAAGWGPADGAST